MPLVVTVHDYHLICPRINLVDASGPRQLKAGADVYNAACAACHGQP